MKSRLVRESLVGESFVGECLLSNAASCQMGECVWSALNRPRLSSQQLSEPLVEQRVRSVCGASKCRRGEAAATEPDEHIAHQPCMRVSVGTPIIRAVTPFVGFGGAGGGAVWRQDPAVRARQKRD